MGSASAKRVFSQSSGGSLKAALNLDANSLSPGAQCKCEAAAPCNFVSDPFAGSCCQVCGC